jgi:hypothetical protein
MNDSVRIREEEAAAACAKAGIDDDDDDAAIEYRLDGDCLLVVLLGVLTTIGLLSFSSEMEKVKEDDAASVGADVSETEPALRTLLMKDAVRDRAVLLLLLLMGDESPTPGD